MGHRPGFLGSPGCRPRPAAPQRRAVGNQRGATRGGRGSRGARRYRLAPDGIDDGAPGQPDEPDDDEGAVPRVDPGQ